MEGCECVSTDVACQHERTLCYRGDTHALAQHHGPAMIAEDALLSVPSNCPSQDDAFEVSADVGEFLR